MKPSRRLTTLSSLGLVLLLGACDSTQDRSERIATRVYAKAQVVTPTDTLLVTVPDLSGTPEERVELAFRYVGTVPSPCQEFWGALSLFSFPDDGEVTVRVYVTAQSEVDVCEVRETEIREAVGVSLPRSIGPVPIERYRILFDRREEEPIEVTYEF